MRCKNCGEEFKSKSTKAVFCSSKCRVAYGRKTKEDEFTEEEKEYIKLGLLNTQALFNAPPHIRKKWVEDARLYKPVYIDQFNYIKGVYGQRAK